MALPTSLAWKADELAEAPNLSHGDYFVETVVEDANGSN